MGLEKSRCEKCIWYDQCKNYELTDDECDYYDPIEPEEDFWEEMSYRKYNERR